jgi:hypothetical protein
MAVSGRKNADDALALGLAQGHTLRDAATGAGISERTAARRWADPVFRKRVGELRGELVAMAAGRVADGMGEAASTLRELLNAAPPAVRLGAARSLLELGVKLRESIELEQRLTAVEARLSEKKKP